MLRFLSKTVGAVLSFVKAFFPVRYSLILAFLPVLFIYVAMRPLPHLLGGLFVLEGPFQLFNVTWISLLLAAMVLVTYRVTRLNAPARFSDYVGFKLPWLDAGRVPPWRLRWLFYLLIGLPIPLAAVYATYHDVGTTWSFLEDVRESDGRVLGVAAGAVAAGVVGSVVLLAGLTWIQHLLLSPDVPSPGVLPFESSTMFQRIRAIRLPWFHRSRAARPNPEDDVWPGYTRLTTNDETGHTSVTWEPGHAQLAMCAMVLLAGYFVSYWLGYQRGWIPTEMSAFPALFFALLALLVVACVLPGTAFFLDYYRIPAPVAIVLLAAVLYWAQVDRAEHFYDLNPPSAAQRQSRTIQLDEVLGHRQLTPDREGRRTLVVVTASGGGIQASAWTAQVLTGLDERYGNPFSRSIGLISSVSGGSVGTMYYLVHRADLHQNDPLPEDVLNDEAIRRIRSASRSSALEATAWGVAYPDLIRKLAPILAQPRIDRGWAVEQAWKREFAESGDLDDIRLTDFGTPAVEHGFPVVVFNATLVETGQRLLISPVIAGTRATTPRFAAPREFMTLYPDSHLPLTTAVRLSATFPYVSPIARPAPGPAAPDDLRYHVADGGYSDNDGLVTAIDWTDRVIRHQQSLADRWFDRIVFLQIQPFPVNAAPRHPSDTRGWMFSTIGPLLAIANVRVASQTERGHLETGLFASSAGTGDQAVEIIPVTFVFPTPDGDDRPPLSWKMTPSQKQRIDDAWQSVLDQANTPHNPLNALDAVFGTAESNAQ